MTEKTQTFKRFFDSIAIVAMGVLVAWAGSELRSLRTEFNQLNTNTALLLQRTDRLEREVERVPGLERRVVVIEVKHGIAPN